MVHAPVGKFDDFFERDLFLDAGVAGLGVEDAVALGDARGQVAVGVGLVFGADEFF